MSFGKEHFYLKFKIDHWHRPWGGTGGERPTFMSKHRQDGSPVVPGPPSAGIFSPARRHRPAHRLRLVQGPVAQTCSRSAQEAGRPVSETGSVCSKKPKSS